MVKLKKGDIFEFTTLPDWADYDTIYFIVNNVSKYTDDDDKNQDLDIAVIVEFDNHLVKGDATGMTLTEDDFQKFGIKIIKDSVILAKLLLVE